MPKISRDILKQFLPNHEAIVAFEQIQRYIEDTSPEQIDQIVEQIGLISEQVTILDLLLSRLKNINATEINNRLDALDVPLSRGRNMAPIEARLDSIDAMPSQRLNLSIVNQRLDALEAAYRRRENLQDISSRIAKIETFLGI